MKKRTGQDQVRKRETLGQGEETTNFGNNPNENVTKENGMTKDKKENHQRIHIDKTENSNKVFLFVSLSKMESDERNCGCKEQLNN